MSITMITILNAVNDSVPDIDRHLYDEEIKSIKDTVNGYNSMIADEYENEHSNENFATYYSRTIKRYTAKFNTIDGLTYFAGVTAKFTLPPITDSAKKAFTKYAKNCKSYSNRQAVTEFNKMTGSDEQNTYYTRIIKKSIYADIKMDFASNEFDVKAKVNQCVKTIQRILYCIANNSTINSVDTFIVLGNIENIADNPVEEKTTD